LVGCGEGLEGGGSGGGGGHCGWWGVGRGGMWWEEWVRGGRFWDGGRWGWCRADIGLKRGVAKTSCTCPGFYRLCAEAWDYMYACSSFSISSDLFPLLVEQVFCLLQ